MKIPTYFPVRTVYKDPLVIIKKDRDFANPDYLETTVTGKFFLVSPTTGKEVALLQMLQHQEEKFAPAQSFSNNQSGNGIMISELAMYKIDQ